MQACHNLGRTVSGTQHKAPLATGQGKTLSHTGSSCKHASVPRVTGVCQSTNPLLQVFALSANEKHINKRHAEAWGSRGSLMEAQPELVDTFVAFPR
jgi:hypothetical protein